MSQKNVGWILVIVGLFMFFKITTVSSFGFYSFRGYSTSGILLVLIILSAIALVVKNNKYTFWLFMISIILLVVSLILGTHISFIGVSLVDLLMIFVPIIFGAGLIIKSKVK